MRVICCALIGTVVALLPTQSAAGPIGYAVSFQATTFAGGPLLVAADSVGSFSAPVSSYSATIRLDQSDISNASFAGSAGMETEIRASGGSIGARISMGAFDNDALSDAATRLSQASSAVSISYWDTWRVESSQLPVGTMVEFQGRMPSVWSATNGISQDYGRGSCGSGGESLYLQESDTSVLQVETIRRSTIGTQTFAGLCGEAAFKTLLPVGVDIFVNLFYFASAQVRSVNPIGPGVGSSSGLVLIYNDLNSFNLFFDPTGPGYSLTTQSGNSFASPSVSVPEPATMLFVSLGLGGLAGVGFGLGRRRSVT